MVAPCLNDSECMSSFVSYQVVSSLNELKQLKGPKSSNPKGCASRPGGGAPADVCLSVCPAVPAAAAEASGRGLAASGGLRLAALPSGVRKPCLDLVGLASPPARSLLSRSLVQRRMWSVPPGPGNLRRRAGGAAAVHPRPGSD